MLNLSLDQSATLATFFLICHWNLNSVSAQNYAKVFLLQAFIILFVFQKPSDDSNLGISVYTLVRSDHSPNNKRGGVCIYCKSFLPLRILNVQYLRESICFELKIGDKTCSCLFLYKSPSQSQDDLETFTKNL